jgi:hypothetical protein
MRSTKLGSAVAAAASVLALAPAGALAAHGHHSVKPIKPGACRLSLSADPHVVTSGESVLVSGALNCLGGGTSGQTVTIYERMAGVPGFKVAGTATTAADGSYTFTPAAIVTDSVFYARALGRRSVNRIVKVAPQVTLIPPAPEGSTLLTGLAHRVTFKGSVNPADAGAEVVLQREASTSSEEWGPIQGNVFVKLDGTFSITHSFAVPGDANLRVVVRPHGKFDQRGISDMVNYVISQAQNANLTLEPKIDPIPFGQPLLLKGVLKAGAGQKVAILGHTFGTPFVKVGEVTTGAGGAWELTIPSATQNTLYKATSGSISSASVFEGVRWVVTAAASATKVTSGTPVTFSGTAAPIRVGHTVYLERANLFGGGYHIVDIGFVTAGGTYSITHDVIGNGKEVYRIKIPGDPLNQGSASAPIEMEVAPAALAVPQVQPTLPH